MKDKLRSCIAEDVHRLYWRDDRNCAVTTLKILSRIFNIPLHSHVFDGAIGMHGAGKFGAQCGLVEGTLLFLGILGKTRGLSEEEIEKVCYSYADKFQEEFSSLLCKELRPQGFSKSNPPHLCEDLTVKSVFFSVEHILVCFQGMDVSIS